ncbi:hypothetical protein [Brevibacillus sp. H7]|uniref:hypothetical protein n=1 Tax=Brevibacillus sp. H7 TaxID=3349138 RepID=UPI003826AA55
MEADRWVNEQTGEVRTGVVISDVVYYRTSRQQEAWEHIKRIEGTKKLYRTHGDKFTNGNMDAIRQLATVLDDTTLGYLLILQTVLQYDGTLGTSKRRFTKVKDFESVLNVKERQAKKVIKILRDVDVLRVNDEGVYCMNPTYHWKGSFLSSDAQKNVKLITSSIQGLVDAGVKAKDLGAVYLLLPYISYRSNLIVHNPCEVNVEKLQPMNLEEIADVIKHDATKVSTKLRKITFTSSKGEMYAFSIASTGRTCNVIVNPLLVRRLADEKAQELLSYEFLTLFLINRP